MADNAPLLSNDDEYKLMDDVESGPIRTPPSGVKAIPDKKFKVVKLDAFFENVLVAYYSCHI